MITKELVLQFVQETFPVTTEMSLIQKMVQDDMQDWAQSRVLGTGGTKEEQQRLHKVYEEWLSKKSKGDK